MKTLQMEDIDWSAEVTQITMYDGRLYCAVCREEYAAFLEVPMHTTRHNSLDEIHVNLPCWHIGNSPGLEVAPDVRVRLLLVAEDEA